MGGLVARYAVGLLQGVPRLELGAAFGSGGKQQGAAAAGTLLGGRLVARSFVTIATPHLGCVSAHPEEVGGRGSRLSAWAC